MRGRSKSSLTFGSAAAALALVAAPLAVSAARQINAPSAQDSSQRFDDLSATAISADLKARGSDPLLGSTDLRRAFVRYNLALGGGHNLNPGSEDAAKSARALNAAMGELKLTSDVQVHTARPGARIRYKLIGENEVGAFAQLSNAAKDDLRIGIYLIWAERGGSVTSAPMQLRIIKPHVPIELEEKAG